MNVELNSSKISFSLNIIWIDFTPEKLTLFCKFKNTFNYWLLKIIIDGILSIDTICCRPMLNDWIPTKTKKQFWVALLFANAALLNDGLVMHGSQLVSDIREIVNNNLTDIHHFLHFSIIVTKMKQKIIGSVIFKIYWFIAMKVRTFTIMKCIIATTSIQSPTNLKEIKFHTWQKRWSF